MPWVRLDDRFPSHRKVALLSDRAFRLHVSALCWASENLTEGKILDGELPVIARLRGMKAAAKELEDRQLWDRVDDGWVIHDFLEYNPDRVKVQKQRENNAARQQSWRDRKKAEREAKKAAEQAARNGVTHGAHGTENDATATGTRHEDDTKTRENHLAKPPSSQVNEIRNAVSNGTPIPSRPVVLPLEELQEETASYAREAAHIGDRPRIPENCQPLVRALTKADLIVGWDLQPNEWFLIEALIKRCGVRALVISARSSWQGARTQPRSATYFLPAWRKLPDALDETDDTDDFPAAVGAEVVPFATSRQQRETDDMFDRAMARAKARSQQESS